MTPQTSRLPERVYFADLEAFRLGALSRRSPFTPIWLPSGYGRYEREALPGSLGRTHDKGCSSIRCVCQPKTHAEYIQATSRVGRDEERPGLVLTLFNIHKPRDRSHYERFRHYHETFYRSVEVASVTPFSARALDRGFAGALVALARHGEHQMTPPVGVEGILEMRAALERHLLDAFLERVRQQPFADEGERDERLRSVQNRVVDLLDSWLKIIVDYRDAGVEMQYQQYELQRRKPLLREMLDKVFESEHHRKFRVNRSLRDVEPDVNLFLRDLSGVQVEDGA